MNASVVPSEAGLTREEALALMERLLEGVPEDRLPLVATQAVWGMGPWSSRTAVVRAMAEWVARRFGEDLLAIPRALVLASVGRADLTDRRYVEAIEECEAAVEEAERGGDERVLVACRALLARALLQNGEVGRGLKVLADVADTDLPPALRPEVLLARGVAHILRGEPTDAGEQFVQAARAAEEVGGIAGSTAQWHLAVAAAGEAHARMRGFCFDDALDPLHRARCIALENDAYREAADLAVLLGVARTVTGRSGADFHEAVAYAARIPQAFPGVDFLLGLPADLCGCETAAEAAFRLEHAAAERLTVRDQAGFVISAIASANLYALAGSRDTAARILDLAHEASSHLQWGRIVEIVGVSRDVIAR